MTAPKQVEKIPDNVKEKINNVKNRLLFLSPNVISGEQREGTKDDYESLSSSNIGAGGFGRVYKVRHKVSKIVYAIKVINKQKILENELIEQMKLEVRIMYKLNHKNIIKLYDHFEDDESFYLVLEFAPKGQLYTKLKLLGRLDERLAAQYIREISSAVEYLHSLNPPIIHRDIKPENILLDENECSKLCDFGWSNFDSQDRKRLTYCGTPEYLAPEMIKQAGHDESLDYWNIGVLTFELLTGKPPFEGATQAELFENIKKVKITWPKDFPKFAKDLISRLLKADPKERIKAKELMEHAWFKANPPPKKSLVNLDKLHKMPSSDGKSSIKKSPITEKKELPSKLPLGSEKELNTGPEQSKKDEKDVILEKLTHKFQEATKELNNLKTSQQEKIKELDQLKKENTELNGHLAKLGKEFTPQAAAESKKMAEEIQKLKLVNKDREEIISELDSKSALSAENDSKMKMLQNELEMHRNEKNEVTKKANELQEKIDSLDKKYEQMKETHENMKKEKMTKTMELETKLELLQNQLVNKAEDEGENNVDTMLDVVKTVLEEIRDKTFAHGRSKKDSEALRQQINEAYKKLSELNTKHENEVYELQVQHSKKLEDIKSQLSEEQKSFTKKEELKVELFKKHVEESKKSLDAQIANNISEEQLLKIYDDQKKQLETLRNKNNTHVRDVMELKGQIQTLGKKIEDLEYQYAMAKAQAFSKEEDGEQQDSIVSDASTNGSKRGSFK